MCMLQENAPPKGVATPSGACDRQTACFLPTYFLVESNLNGSSLPHCSFLPSVLSLSERACDRWIASWTICGVDDVGLPDGENVCGGPAVNASAVSAAAAGAAVVVAVCANADGP